MSAFERRIDRLRDTANYYKENQEMDSEGVSGGDGGFSDGPPDYNNMTDEDLATLAVEKNIDITGMTRNKVVKALEKAV